MNLKDKDPSEMTLEELLKTINSFDENIGVAVNKEDKNNNNNNNTSYLPNINEINFDNIHKLINILKKDYNLHIIINHNDKSLSIKDKNNKLIGEIKIAKYKDGNFKRDIHLYNVIEDEFKGKGYGKILFELYILLTEENSDFILPQEEYTNIVSMINLYKKFGYEPKYKIIFGIDYPIELTEEDIKQMNKIITNYKDGYQEQKLGYTVILEKVGN